MKLLAATRDSNKSAVTFDDIFSREFDKTHCSVLTVNTTTTTAKRRNLCIASAGHHHTIQ
jgi:hypothetical protein